jgi:hypothetical protein
VYVIEWKLECFSKKKTWVVALCSKNITILFL